jgi:uncharacterized protein (DUF58 family)
MISAVTSYFLIPLSMVFVGVFAFLAAAFSSTSLATFAAMTLVLIVAVRLWGFLALARLETRLECSADRLYRDETLELKAHIENRKLLPVWLSVELAHSAALKPLSAASSELADETGLSPFGATDGVWGFTAARRGLHTLGPVTLAAGDLLGLHRVEKALPFRRTLVVFPKLIALKDASPPFLDYFGIHPAKGIIEDPAWYEGTREYSGNKPARYIHWKASARFDTLQEKIFEPTSHQKIFIVVEGTGFAAEEDPEGFETALEIAASLTVKYSEAGASIAAVTDRAVEAYPAILPLGRGPEHVGAILELLARCGISPGKPVAELFAGTRTEGAGFVVIARAPSERTKTYFTLSARRRDKLVFIFSDAARDNDILAYPGLKFSSLISKDASA